MARYAAEGDLVVVTSNASDFRGLYATRSLHGDLVIIIRGVNRERQRQLFRGALEELARIGEPINRVLEVDLEDDEATFHDHDRPASDA